MYNLHDELKKHLHVNKRERIHACASQPEFQFMFSCFHNYEVSSDYLSIHQCVSVFAHVYVCIYIYIYVCMYVCVCTHSIGDVVLWFFLDSNKEGFTR